MNNTATNKLRDALHRLSSTHAGKIPTDAIYDAMVGVLAEAIVEEREGCAGVADYWADYHRPKLPRFRGPRGPRPAHKTEPSTESKEAHKRACEKIAEAIRHRGLDVEVLAISLRHSFTPSPDRM